LKSAESRTLHLLRHAKSSWSNPELADKQRPLNKRGQKACKTMAPHLVETGCLDAEIFVSPATRAQETIKRIHAALPGKNFHFSTESALYTFDANEVLGWLRKLPDTCSAVTVVGHNPALTELANFLGDEEIDNVPTCGYVKLSKIKHAWSGLAAGSAHTELFLKPRLLKEG
jgi:phosphohistidine phosphatase